MADTPTQGTHPAGHAKDIHYLALEGGGGKGGAYLGAVIALEELMVLPILPEQERNQIQGIAGASAGSITAFLLALGQTSTQMWQGIVDGVYTSFLDGSAGGRARRATFVDDDVEPGGELRDPRRSRWLSVLSLLPKVSLSTLLFVLLAKPAWRKVQKSSPGFDDKLLRAMRRNPIGYIRNVLSDPGMFPAFAVRKFLTEQLAERLALRDGEAPSSHYEEAGQFTFTEFLDLTGIDLVIAGTNLSTGVPHFFSAQTTPTFPVVEAVGLSMSIPIMFKSVWIETQYPEYEKYRGWWGDGGISLNLPLHAFNQDAFGQIPDEARARAKLPLNPHMLGITLNDGDLSQFGVPPPVPQIFPSSFGMMGLVMEAMLYSGTEGQIRDQEERRQVVWLQAYCLETYDLTVDPVLVAATVLDSRARIHMALEGGPPFRFKPRPRILNKIISMLLSNWGKLEAMVPPKYADKVRDDCNRHF